MYRNLSFRASQTAAPIELHLQGVRSSQRALELISRELELDDYGLSKTPVPGDGEVIVDIGANVGGFSILAAKMFPGAQVYAFEPQAATFSDLERNIRANGVQDQVIATNAAVGAVTETRAFTYTPGNAGASSIVRSIQSMRKWGGVIDSVPVLSVHDAFERAGLRAPAIIAMLKLDCEGCEFEVFSLLPWSRVRRLGGELHRIYDEATHALALAKRGNSSAALSSVRASTLAIERLSQPGAPLAARNFRHCRGGRASRQVCAGSTPVTPAFVEEVAAAVQATQHSSANSGAGAPARGEFSVLGPGHCGPAALGGDCATGLRGAWQLGPEEVASWTSARESCSRRCLACSQCAYVSFSLKWRDCSWHASCGQLRDSAPTGFRSLAHVARAGAQRAAAAVAERRRREHLGRALANWTSPVSTSQRRLALVMPVHPPKYGQLLDFIDSMLSCRQDGRFLLLLVLSCEADEQLLLEAFASDRLASQLWRLRREGALLTLVDSAVPWMLEQNRMTETIRTHKAFMGLSHAFRLPSVSFALSIDADAEFTSERDFSSHFEAWSQQQLVLGPAPAYKQHAGGCGLPGWCRSWWGDAPLFERKGFDRFVAGLQASGALNASAARFPWDQCAYSCFNLFVRHWGLVDIAPFVGGGRLDKMDSKVQDQIAKQSAYRGFLWSRDPSSDRLLQFHTDRAPYCSARSGMCALRNVTRRAALCDPRWARWTG